MARKSKVKAYREAAVIAWELWQSKEIDANERDAMAKPYMDYVGLARGSVSDADEIMELRKRYKGDQYKREAAIYRQSVYERERDIDRRLAKGKLKITLEMEQSLIDGKRTQEQRDKSVDRWANATERTIRQSMKAKSERVASEQADASRTVSEKQPGIEWKGGQLRAGSMQGQKMNPVVAAAEIVDKYNRSSMPKLGILPNMNARGETADGEILEIKIPESITREIMRQAQTSGNPDPSALIELLLAFCRQYDIAEIDLYADDSDEYAS